MPAQLIRSIAAAPDHQRRPNQRMLVAQQPALLNPSR
jgi:hypothetical protein